MLPRYRDTRGMDHVRLDATRLEPARQPEAVAAGFEGNRDRGLKKNTHRLLVTCALANLFMARRHLLRGLGA